MFEVSAELLSASTIAVRDCMGVKAGERVLVVTDEPMRLSGTRSTARRATWASRAARGHAAAQEQRRGAAARGRRSDETVRRRAVPDVEIADAHRLAARGEPGGARVATLPGVTEEIMVRCMNADYNEIAARTHRLCALMEKTKAVRVTAPAGTDITMPIAGRRRTRVQACSARKGSGATCRPARRTRPARGPLERRRGRRRVDGRRRDDEPAAPDRGRGRVRDGHQRRPGSAEAHFAARAARQGRPDGGEFGIGTNNKAILTGIILEDEKVMGTIDIAFGDNKSMGGSVRVASHLDGLVKSPTVWFDDQKVMEDGRLLVG